MKIFDNGALEIFAHEGEGYERTMHYENWRVAFLNYAERFDQITYLERHMCTDEVFVLLRGEAKLIVGEEKTEHRLEENKIYNVKRGIWHAVKVSRDAQLLIVENHDTSAENTEYLRFDKALTVEL
ncbi:MAG: hypothetical protein IJW51_07800 [Clostridia bacterium]|nr:hypothetical protein [Clostridia bacterium]